LKNVAGRLTGKRRSASTAKERLQLVLIHDRADLPPGVMEDLRDEIIEVISRHVDVDRELVELRVSQEGRNQRLLADIPLQPNKKRRGR
jgi:cell division topological specificity factor